MVEWAYRSECEAEGMRGKNVAGRTTRDYLRIGTAAAHDTLDVRLGTLVEGDVRGYAQFLEIQYRAREYRELAG